MTDPTGPTRIESLPDGPLSFAEAHALDAFDAFEACVVAGSLVVHNLTLVVGLAIDTGDRVVAAVYQLDERGWYRVPPAEGDSYASLDEAVDAVEHVLTSGTGPDRTVDTPDGTEARLSTVGPEERDRLLEQYEARKS